MEYQFQTQCDTGAYRSNNEDAILFGIKNVQKTSQNQRKIAWMAIADGMGGHKAGEVASEIFTNQLASAINETDLSSKTDWIKWIDDQIQIANLKIFEQASGDPSQQGMGTTGVVVILTDKKFYVGWVGDSRCYQLTNKLLAQITKDHTMVQLFVDKGAMTQEQADKANNKNMLSKAIGIKAKVEVETTQHPLHKGDVLFLSTDGLHDSLSEAQITSYLIKASQGDPIEAPMLKDAIKAGSKDNISFGSIATI